MAALGGLVAGVAHAINTPVGVSITASSFLLDKTTAMLENISKKEIPKEEVKQFLYTVSEATATIDKNLKRGVELIRHFKQVAVDQSTENLRKFNLKQYVDGTLLSLRYHYKRSGHTITVNCPETLVIESYPGAFAQIITNLLMNSLIHGLNDKDNGQIVFNISSDGRKLHFQYSDNSTGMDEETVKGIFEPFFTTKRGEESTGLGMHIVYNIVTQTWEEKYDAPVQRETGRCLTSQFRFMELPTP
ncbi:MAG: sensor histidine kinase [Dissulfuribacterales bacterium]